MSNGSDRLDRVEGILEQVSTKLDTVTTRLDSVSVHLASAGKRLDEMSARQQYHDEAFERHDAEMKLIREAIAADGENIRALARIASAHNERLEDLENPG